MVITVNKNNKPSKVEIAKNEIMQIARNNGCITHKMAMNRLLNKDVPKEYSKSTFDKAWRDLCKNNIIVEIPEGDPDRKEYEKYTVNEKKFYRFNAEKEPDIYSSLSKSIENIDTIGKALPFVDQLSLACNKLDKVVYYEDLVSKILDKVDKIEDQSEGMIFHFMLLRGILDSKEKWDSLKLKYSKEFLKKIQNEIATFSNRINGGGCNTVSALGIVSLAFTIIWDSNRTMGREEFKDAFDNAVKSLKAMKTPEDLNEISRNFSKLECLENDVVEYTKYFSEAERKEFCKGLLEAYFPVDLSVNPNLKILIDSTITWLNSHS